jgi:hypothetical protein
MGTPKAQRCYARTTARRALRPAQRVVEVEAEWSRARAAGKKLSYNNLEGTYVEGRWGRARGGGGRSRARLGDKEEWRWAGCVVQKRVAVYDIPGRCAHVNDCWRAR